MSNKSKRMREVEAEFCQSLENLLPPMITSKGLTWTAKEIGVTKATLNYWLLALGIKVRRIALAPWEKVEIVRNDE